MTTVQMVAAFNCQSGFDKQLRDTQERSCIERWIEQGGNVLCRQINVGFALKKDGKGERHGTPAERLLAEQMRKAAAAQSRPNTLFAMGAFPFSVGI